MFKTISLVLAVSLASVSLTSCATVKQHPMAWQKDGASGDQLSADMRTCQYEASKAVAAVPNPFYAANTRNKLIKECLEARGWVYRTVRVK